MSNFVETWKGIATALGRSERWCRYMARRAGDPLPVFKVGGIVRLNSTDLEDWLSTMTDIGAGEAQPQTAGGTPALAPQFLRADLQTLQRAIEKLSLSFDGAKGSGGSRAGDTESIEQLADAVASLVTQMREEQKMVRQWAQGQQTQQNEIQRLLIRATGSLGRGAGRVRTEDEG